MKKIGFTKDYDLSLVNQLFDLPVKMCQICHMPVHKGVCKPERLKWNGKRKP